MLRWLSVILIAGAAAVLMQAQAPEILLPRPGLVVVTDVTGEATATVSDQRKAIKTDERLRVGSTITTGRKSMVTVILSNAATLRLGSESELEIEEFGQAPVSGSLKFAELKEEPTISRTRLRLVRGNVTVEVKPLKVARGSTFMLSMLAGTIRLGDGTFHAMVEMSDLGLGVSTLQLDKGAAEFEIAGAGAPFAAVPLGRKLAFAMELERATGVVKVGEMPKDTPKAKE